MSSSWENTCERCGKQFDTSLPPVARFEICMNCWTPSDDIRAVEYDKKMGKIEKYNDFKKTKLSWLGRIIHRYR